MMIGEVVGEDTNALLPRSTTSEGVTDTIASDHFRCGPLSACVTADC
jgi:hypothetical protein